VLEPLRTRLDAALGETNREATERVQVTRIRASAELRIVWAINGNWEGNLSLAVAATEAREILQSIDHKDPKFRRAILKGTFALATPDGPHEGVVLRAAYARSTWSAIDFVRFDRAQDRSILDLADELRLAVELGGRGIPSEPAVGTPDNPRRR
jgi:hypothetical protein